MQGNPCYFQKKKKERLLVGKRLIPKFASCFTNSEGQKSISARAGKTKLHS
jgi:hypothetical protein